MHCSVEPTGDVALRLGRPLWSISRWDETSTAAQERFITVSGIDSQIYMSHVVTPAGRLKRRQRLPGRATMRPSSSARWLRPRTRASSIWSSSTCPVSDSSCGRAAWPSRWRPCSLQSVWCCITYWRPLLHHTSQPQVLPCSGHLSSRCCTAPACSPPGPLLLLLRASTAFRSLQVGLLPFGPAAHARAGGASTVPECQLAPPQHSRIPAHPSGSSTPPPLPDTHLTASPVALTKQKEVVTQQQGPDSYSAPTLRLGMPCPAAMDQQESAVQPTSVQPACTHMLLFT